MGHITSVSVWGGWVGECVFGVGVCLWVCGVGG